MTCREKKWYPSQRSAERFAERVAADWRSQAVQHAYKCRQCAGWHLTTTGGHKNDPRRWFNTGQASPDTEAMA